LFLKRDASGAFVPTSGQVWRSDDDNVGLRGQFVEGPEIPNLSAGLYSQKQQADDEVVRLSHHSILSG
jgi:hypothetical protein